MSYIKGVVNGHKVWHEQKGTEVVNGRKMLLTKCGGRVSDRCACTEKQGKSCPLCSSPHMEAISKRLSDKGFRH